MKKIFLIAIILVASNLAFSQLSFSVSPSMLKSNATFGYKFKNFNPYIGISSNSFSVNTEENYDYIEYLNNGDPLITTRTIEIEGKLGVYMPVIGLKYFIPFNDNILAYANVSISKPLFLYIYDEEKTPVDPIISPVPDDEINTELSILGTSFGVGAEYFMNNSFSIGGEFGFSRYNLKLNQETKSYQSRFDGSYFPVENDYSVDANYTQTYSRITINFYLNRGEGNETVLE